MGNGNGLGRQKLPEAVSFRTPLPSSPHQCPSNPSASFIRVSGSIL